MSTSGIIYDVFQQSQLAQWESYFKKWTKTGDHILNCYGIDGKNTPAEKWFQDNVFSKVKQAIGNDKMQSVFGMYAESVNPYTLHDDAYHIEQNNINGEPCISWLIPYKVDGSVSKVEKASTIVFNELDVKGDVLNSINDEIKEKYLTHCNNEHLDRLSIDKIMHWAPGSLIWWDMKNYHCSGSFNDFKTKEMFVGHTFIAN